jgi:hypothetical protein
MIAPYTNWGLLTYKTTNLGDDIQSLAAMQHIPRVNKFVDRDDMQSWAAYSNLNIILNAWWSHYPENLMSVKSINFNPLFISFHLAHEGIKSNTGTDMDDVLSSSYFRNILEMHGPIGCRDFYTLEKLEKSGIPAYFSGCLTTTIKRDPNIQVLGDSEQLLVTDLSPKLVSSIEKISKNKIKYVVNDTLAILNPEDRLVKAQHQLNEIQRSVAVITSRLHIALPALALGVPVVLIANMRNNPRLESFNSWVNTSSQDGILEKVKESNYSGWEPNPKTHLEFAMNMEKLTAKWVQKFSVKESVKSEQKEIDIVQVREQALKRTLDLDNLALTDLKDFELSYKARFRKFQGKGFRTRFVEYFSRIYKFSLRELNYLNLIVRFRLVNRHQVINCIDKSNLTYLTKFKLLDLARSLNYVNKNKVKGCIIEYGVGLGGSAIFLEKCNTTKRKMVLFDVFSMIPAPTQEDELDSEKRYKEISSFASKGLGGNIYYGYEKDLLSKVKQNFNDFDINPNDIQFVVGDIRSNLQLEDLKIALAHIDLDWYQGVKIALVKTWGKLSVGGILIVDDYWAYRGCMKATNEFLETIPNQFKLETDISFKIIKTY